MLFIYINYNNWNTNWRLGQHSNIELLGYVTGTSFLGVAYNVLIHNLQPIRIGYLA